MAENVTSWRETPGAAKGGSEHRSLLRAAAGEQIPGPSEQEHRALSIHCPPSPSQKQSQGSPRKDEVSQAPAPSSAHFTQSLHRKAHLQPANHRPNQHLRLQKLQQKAAKAVGGVRGVLGTCFLLHLQVEAQPLSVPSLLETHSQHRKEICPLFQILLQKNTCLIYPENLTSVKWILSTKNIVC